MKNIIYQTGFLLLSIPLLFSCSTKKERTLPLLRMVTDNTSYSTLCISEFNDRIISALQEKTTEREYGERSQYWYQKAMIVKMVSDSMLNYIKEMQADLDDEPLWIADKKTFDYNSKKDVTRILLTEGRGKDFFIKLTNYRDKVLAADTLIRDQFDRFTDPGNSVFFDSTNIHSFPEQYFEEATTAEGKLFLAAMKNRVSMDEYHILSFCLARATPVMIRDYFGPEVLLSLSSSYVKPGDKITLNVIIGDYAQGIDPVVQANRTIKKIKNDGNDGIIITASDRPGKYIVPVKISFKDENGNEVTTERKISYEVAPVQ